VTDSTDPPETPPDAPANPEAPLAPYQGSDPLSGMGGAGLAPDDFDPAFFDEMSALGLTLPVAPPTKIRRAFDMLNKMFAAIMLPSDFMYTISYTENGKPKQLAYTSLEHAQKAAEAYGNVPIKASPKKSGINRLAVGLGIEAVRVETMGLPKDPSARYSCVIYEFTHKATGRKAEGIGWADLDEKGGHMSRHDAIATADTRAYNRGVLRLSGFGDVSAEEILSVGMLEGDRNEINVPDEMTGQQTKRQERRQGGGQQQQQQAQQSTPPMLKQLPAATTPEVLASSMAWAAALAERSPEQRLAPAAQQSQHEARTLRALARGGDMQAAQQLGAKGLDWSGPALLNGKAFFVETAPDEARARARAGTAAKTEQPKVEAAKTEAPPESNQPEGAQAEPPPASDMSSSSMTSPPPGDTIPSSMAKNLTTKLLEKLGTIQRCKAWIKETYGVDSSIHLSPAQYSDALERIKNMKTEG
jgi:hypothetical protein